MRLASRVLVVLLALTAPLVAQTVNFDRWASKDGSYTTQQTGVALWTPTTGLSQTRLAVVSVDIQCGGTTAGNVMVWFGASGDTTFTQGTDQPLTYMDCGTPSATNAPGKVFAFGSVGVPSLNPGYILRVTTSAALTVRVIVHGYEL